MKAFIHKSWLVLALFAFVFGPVGVRAAEGDGTGPKPPEFSAELISCLKTTFGAATYAEIQRGDREPTEDEFEKGEPCFEQFGPKGDPAQQPQAADLNFAPGTEQCLKDKLGENFKTEFVGQKTKEQAKAFRAKTRDCFGKNVAGNGPPELPEDVKSCIVGAVGQAEADTMLKGNPPEPGSELFQKIESAKCFRNFGPPPGHDRPEIPAEAKACVEKIMGHSFDEPDEELTEEQKQQIGKECFGGRGPDGQGPPEMPEAVQSCLNDAFGDSLEDLKKGPEFLTEEQKGKADECFRKNNFHPGGPGGPNGEGGPQLPPEKRECVERIMGGKLDGPREPTEEQKQQIGRECFGGQGGPGGPGGPPPGSDLPADKRECVERIMGKPAEGQHVEPTEEQKQQIGRECFGGGGPGGPGGPGPNGEPGQSGPRNECVERITGGNPPNDDQQKQINRECFGGQTQGQPPQDVNQGPGGSGGPSSSGGPQPSDTQRACIERIAGPPSPGSRPTPEQQVQIDHECFGR